MTQPKSPSAVAADNLSEFSPEVLRALESAHLREVEFFRRHGIDYQLVDNKSGKATPAWRAWVLAVENEHRTAGANGKTFLDCPLGRKAFILGFIRALPLESEDDKTNGRPPALPVSSKGTATGYP